MATPPRTHTPRNGRSAPQWALLLWLLAALGGCVSAHPAYFFSRGHAASCTDAPAARLAGHLAPTPDAGIRVQAVLGGQQRTALCPGAEHELHVAWGTHSRQALLSVSAGALAAANVAGCPNALTTPGSQSQSSLSAHWQLPCNVSGALLVRVTTGTSALGSLQKASASFAVDASCAAASCPHTATPLPAADSSGGAAAGGTAGSSDGAAEAGQLSDATGDAASSGMAVDTHLPDANSTADAAVLSVGDDPAAASLALLDTTDADSASRSPATDVSGGAGAAGGSSSCAASSLGYSCSQAVADGVSVHWAWGVAQPGNTCTQQAGLDTSLGDAFSLLHLAIASTLPGYAAVGFPATPGVMVPADAVIGSADAATGATQAAPYRLSSEQPAGVAASPPGAWATGVGAVRVSVGGAQTTIVCLSRPLRANNGTVAPQVLDPAAVALIWAAHTSPRLEAHAHQGALTLSLASGRAAGQAGDAEAGLPAARRYAAQIAHGALQVAAFCVLMPAGVLVARHKWLFADAQTGRIGRSWCQLHQLMQHTAIACTLASFAVAMGLWFRAHGAGAALHALCTPHLAAGVAAPAAAVLQGVNAALRPTLDAGRRRRLWRAVHVSWGMATLGLGVANCVVGAVLAHDLKGMPWAAWLVPICAPLGLLAVAALGLEACKLRLQLQGRYDPRTHTCKPTLCAGAAAAAVASAFPGTKAAVTAGAPTTPGRRLLP